MYRLTRRYRLDEPVGAGGNAVVWRGHDTRLRRPVAVKIPSAGRTDRPRRRLFRNEAVTAARLSHPHIVSVYDYGETGTGIPFLVMEFVDGRTLSQQLASHGPMHHTHAAAVCGVVASALAAIHAYGLVHGDLKPDNVMVGPLGPRILDLGTANRSEAGTVNVGTPAYMAPEQPGGRPSPEADMYSFGLLVRECLTARRSRPDADPPHIRAANAGRWPWIPDTVPGEMSELVAACLAREPAERPTAAQAAVVLRRTVAGRAV